MAFPTKQNPLDWTTQYWNIVLGKRVDFDADTWLLGPMGRIEEEADRFVERMAKENKLVITRNLSHAGLVESMDEWPVSLSPKIRDFYLRTSDYELAVQSIWKPVFGSLGYLVAKLFSRRIQQLNLPQNTRDRALAFDSEIIKLVDHTGRVEFTIWRRRIRDTGETVFFGIYTTCRIPSGEFCVKAVFPLPRGCATVIFRTQSDSTGNLSLISSGKKYGDPGFYFLVEDRKGCLWKNYLPSLRERIIVTEGGDGTLIAEHTLKLWSFQVYSMIYSIEKKPQETII